MLSQHNLIANPRRNHDHKPTVRCYKYKEQSTNLEMETSAQVLSEIHLEFKMLNQVALRQLVLTFPNMNSSIKKCLHMILQRKQSDWVRSKLTESRRLSLWRIVSCAVELSKHQTNQLLSRRETRHIKDTFHNSSL